MDTVVTHQQPRIRPPVVSRSLQTLAPLSVALLDEHDRPVRLSSVGFVLHATRMYHLRVVPPPDPDFQEIRLEFPPEFIELGGNDKFDDQGCTTCELRLRVKFELGRWVRTLPCGELDVQLVFSPASGKRRQRVPLPVVVRPGILPMIYGGAVSLITSALPMVGELLTKSQEPLGQRLLSWLASPYPYFILGGAALVLACMYGWIWYQLRARCHELYTRYLQRYTA